MMFFLSPKFGLFFFRIFTSCFLHAQKIIFPQSCCLIFSGIAHYNIDNSKSKQNKKYLVWRDIYFSTYINHQRINRFAHIRVLLVLPFDDFQHNFASVFILHDVQLLCSVDTVLFLQFNVYSSNKQTIHFFEIKFFWK